MTSILKVDTIQDADGNNIINESGNTITIGASGDTTNIIGTLQNDGAAVGGDNTPAWSVRLNATQNISNQTYTKVNFDTEIVDTDNAYDNSSNYRWTCPSGEAGKYLITTSIHFQSGGNAGWEYGWIQLRKNGTAIGQSIVDERNSNGRQFGITYTIVNDVAVSDYYEIWGYISNTTGTPGFGGGSSGEDTFKSTFAGYKLIGV